MGNNLTQQQQTLSDSLQQQYFFQSNQFLVHKGTQRPCTLHRISAFSKEQSAAVERNIAHYSQANCNSISKLKQYFKLDNSGYCSDQQKFYLVFDGHNSPNIKEQYFSRRYTGQGFSQDEIQSIVSCMLCGIRHYYQVFNRKESRISLDSVCIDRSNNNKLWVKDPWLVQKQNDSGQLPINFFASYPSPQKIQASNHANIDFSEYNSDLFSIGIFGLQFLQMNFRDDIYAHRKFVDRQKLAESLNSIKNGRLRSGLGVLLSEDPNQRLNIFRYWDVNCHKKYSINSIRSQNLRASIVQPNYYNLKDVGRNSQHLYNNNVNMRRSYVETPPLNISPPKQNNQVIWRPKSSQVYQVPQIQINKNEVQSLPNQFNRSLELKNNIIQPIQKKEFNSNFKKKNQNYFVEQAHNNFKITQPPQTPRVTFQSQPKMNMSSNESSPNSINQGVAVLKKSQTFVPPVPPQVQFSQHNHSQPHMTIQVQPHSNQQNLPRPHTNFQYNQLHKQNNLHKSFQTPKFNYQSPSFNANNSNNKNSLNYSQKNQQILNSFNLYGSVQQPHQSFNYYAQTNYHQGSHDNSPIMTKSIINPIEQAPQQSAQFFGNSKISSQDNTQGFSAHPSISLRQTKHINESQRNSSSFPISSVNPANSFNQTANVSLGNSKNSSNSNIKNNNANFSIGAIQNVQTNSNQIKSISSSSSLNNNSSGNLMIKQKLDKIERHEHSLSPRNMKPAQPLHKAQSSPQINPQKTPTSPSSMPISSPAPISNPVPAPQSSLSPNQSTPPPPIRNPNKYNSTIVQVNQQTPNQSSQSQNENNQDIEFIDEEYETGSKYEGFKKNGLRHGKGKFYYQDGGYYDGQWKKNQMHGWGKLYYEGGQLAYEGNWAHDQFHGYGKVYNDNPVVLEGGFDYTNFDLLDDYWQFYQGMLANDTKEGRGRIQLTNKQIFEGDFHSDRIQGFGKFLRRDGTIVEGIWRDSRLIKILNSNDIYR